MGNHLSVLKPVKESSETFKEEVTDVVFEPNFSSEIDLEETKEEIELNPEQVNVIKEEVELKNWKKKSKPQENKNTQQKSIKKVFVRPPKERQDITIEPNKKTNVIIQF